LKRDEKTLPWEPGTENVEQNEMNVMNTAGFKSKTRTKKIDASKTVPRAEKMSKSVPPDAKDRQERREVARNGDERAKEKWKRTPPVIPMKKMKRKSENSAGKAVGGVG